MSLLNALREPDTMTHPLLKDIRDNPLLWLLVFVPAVFVAREAVEGRAHAAVRALRAGHRSVGGLLSHATESVAAKTGDTVGGLLNATLGNLTELVIALTALRAGQYTLVKASIAGAIVTNTLFMLGASFLLGGLKHHVQEFNRVSARLQASAALPGDDRAARPVGGRRSRRGNRRGFYTAAQRRALPCC